jgi:Flp pilus assembly protein TadG
MKILRKQEGQVLVLTCLCMSALVGFVALATDAGLLFRAKRKMQVAADAAAFAGASELYYSGATNINSVATAAAKSNGVDTAVANNYVKVFNPPIDGPNTGCASCVEVIVRTPNTTFLTAFTGKNSFNVGARAVAGAPGASSNCIWLMDPTTSGQLQMQGGANSVLNASGCSVYLNSNSSSAVDLKGNPNVTIVALNDVSNQNVSTKAKFTGTVNEGVTPQSSPLPTDFQGPTPSNGQCTNTDTTTTALSSTYSPPGGAVSGGVVCFTKAVTLNNGAILPGAANNGMLYVFENSVTVANGATVAVGSASYNSTTGAFSNTLGATMDVEGGAFNINSGQANLSVYAPTSGTYNGIALMQPKSNTSSSSDNGCSGVSCLAVQFGSSSTYFDGMIFNPGGMVVMHDAGGGVKATGIIAATMNIKSSSLVIDNYSSHNPNTSPLRLITMVE